MIDSAIRIMCVDDNELVVEAIKRRIEFEPMLQWAGCATHTDGLVERLRPNPPDVILLDIDMPGDSFDLLRQLSQSCTHTRVIMFSGYVRPDYIDRAIEAGAWGYVSKNASIEEVLTAVRQVAAGEFALTSEVMAEQARPSVPHVEDLSYRT